VPVISWRGEPLALPRRQARAVLYILAHEGKPLGREKLADLLWPEKAPAAARRNLARLLSLLRSELPVKELLGSDNAAVWLDPGQASCDVQDFQQLGKSNLPQEWKTAVSLYRGSFLDSFTLESYTFEEWQESNALDLERRYLETLAKLVKKLQAGGETADAISYARRYLAIDDLAETIHRALIALYAARGERTAALQQYSHFTEILHRELGVEPLPETRAVFEAARDGQVSPKPIPVPQPSWSTLPGLDLPLVGRQNAWNALDEAYRQEQSGGAILISGAPGVGKSRLMQDFASRQSSLVLVGNCHTGSQALFFQPLVQALRQGLLNTDQGRLVKAIWLSELSILLPELREQYPDLPAPLPLEPAQSQARLLEAITQAFLTLAEHSPLLLCLDDLHAADEGTLAWLNYATRHLVNSRICLLVTYRTQESSKLAAWQRALSRSGRGHQIYLDSLDEPAVATLVTLAGALQETAVELVPELHEATGGNAYFLLETIRELLESDSLQNRTGPVPLPQTVREAVLRRADRLSPLTRQVLDAASVLYPLLEIPLLSKTSARSEMEVAGALDDLTRRQLLIPDGSGFRFQHDLTREAVYRALSEWRARLLHRRAAQLLEQQPSRPVEYTAVIAAHYEAAGDYSLAIAGYRKAAIEAQEINAFTIASAYVRKAFALLPQGGELAEIRPDLLERLGDCLRLGGQFGAAYPQYQEAFSSLADNQLLARARIKRKMAENLWPLDRTTEAIAQVKQAADLITPLLHENQEDAISEWAAIYLVMAWSYYWLLDLPGIESALNELEPLLDIPGYNEQKQRYYVYQSLANDFLGRRYRADSRVVRITQNHFETARKSGDLYLTADTEFRLGFSLLWSGQIAEARDHLEHSMQICEDLAVYFLWVQNATYFMVAARLMGDVQAVAAIFPKVLERTDAVGSKAYLSTTQANGAWLAYRKGDREEGIRLARDVAGQWDRGVTQPFQWLARWVLLATALEDNNLEEAIIQARVMSTPPQLLLPDPLNEALETAVSLWEQGDHNNLRKALIQAKNLAEQAHYL